VKKAFFFDMDGVLADTTSLHRLALKKASFEYGQRVPDVGTGTTRSKLRAANINENLIEKIYARKRELYDESIGKVLLPWPQLVKLFNTIRSKGGSVTVCSNSNKVSVRKILIRLGAGDEAIVTSDMVLRGKPDPAIYAEAVSRVDAPLEHCVAFEDSSQGVLAAVRAGIPDVVFCTTTTVIREAESWL
jgi:HAD superfamily hydrolase (TIGR01509 family)